MSNNNDQKTMNSAAFEAFIRELSSKMGELDISNRQSTDFLNEAIRTVKATFPHTEKIEELQEVEEDDRPWIQEDKE